MMWIILEIILVPVLWHPDLLFSKLSQKSLGQAIPSGNCTFSTGCTPCRVCWIHQRWNCAAGGD